MYEVIWWLEGDDFSSSVPAKTRTEAIERAQRAYDNGAIKVQVKETIYTIKRKDE
ncbi:hypothetical protein BCB4_0118 [Bacillus phage B4]|uniref:Uncharacterized protein n=2 Tax=Bequatrovirus B4 TaxID=1918005 RepID=J9PRG5_9CAUD|nr:hypothetical protein BCB4_0118 [Bacillus phage B4]YP_009783711.1 hypothetical protein QLX26_gp115 [Bacillus phage B5S]MEB9013973.1 hypothetical protein [Bacillus cereus]AEW47349.1 hypothetical protein B5S_0115 [Bacillus phage B5S]AEZ65911.1 hypothetical protein BCB4_0118 [Bacillus phage B4]MEB9190680.1 hypothetical protein [Bacillus cereus]